MSTSKDSSTPDSSEESTPKTPKKTGDRPTKAAKDAVAGTEDKSTADKKATEKKATEEKTPSKRRGSRPQPVPGMNPTWWAPVMCTLMIVGLLWIVVFYLLSNGTKDTWPIPGIGYGNLAIGFGMIMAGFLMTTRWK